MVPGANRHSKDAKYPDLCTDCWIKTMPAKRRASVRKELHVLGDVLHRIPELDAYFHIWDCPIRGVPCPVAYKPDSIWVINETLLHLEVDEGGNAHEDDDGRLAAIFASSEMRFHRVIRINVDQDHTGGTSGSFKRVRLQGSGELAWQGTAEFTRRMQTLEFVLRDAISKAEAGIEPGKESKIKLFF